MQFITTLQRLYEKDIETHTLAFEVYFYMNRTDLMYESIERAFSINKKNATLHHCLIRWYQKIDNDTYKTNFKNLTNFENAKALNDWFISENDGNMENIIVAAQCLIELDPLDPTTQGTASNLIVKFDVTKLTLEVSMCLLI